jgi:putative ABC transport system permease protein
MEIGRWIPLIFTLGFRNLFRDRIRLVATLVGIIFAIVLVTVQLGLFLGFQRMVTTMIDHAQADLWIGPAETQSFEATSLLDGRQRFRALSIEGVVDVAPVMMAFTYWRKPDGRSLTPVFLVGVEIGTGGLQPWSIVAGSVGELAAAEAVAVDQTYFERLGVRALGDYAEIADNKVRVAAVTQGIRSFATTPYVFASLNHARAWMRAPPSSASYFMVRVAPGANVNAIRQKLAADLSDAEVLTPDEFRRRSKSYWLFGTGAGAALFGSALLGLVVGTVIVGQTLYSSTKDHLAEFATLRAIGSSRRYIYKVILWQALLSAVIGFSIAAGIGLLLARASIYTALPIVMTPMLFAGLFVLTLAMCAISAISAIVVVTRIDPVMVFAR